ncbi:DUF3944 domain-containing protein [Phytobacter diazotrophicus]|uniref:DUF3944 domain-containing protein n=1 Tax=Phytobacter diazotrophicus TaxID=395631 RepID=UPI002FF8A0D8
MAVYRNDPDLNLLGQCSNDELQLLVSILTTDPPDGDTRRTEGLTSTPEFRLLAPDHRSYWQLIAAELQRYGANTLASLVRLGQGVTYREIQVDLCDKLDVNYNQKSSTETIELALLMKVLEKTGYRHGIYRGECSSAGCTGPLSHQQRHYPFCPNNQGGTLLSGT